MPLLLGTSCQQGCLLQVPCPPDDLDSPVSKKARADVGQWQQQQSKATANQQRQQAQQQQQQQAAAKRQSKDTNLVDMHQFWKYFHLVPAQVRYLHVTSAGVCQMSVQQTAALAVVCVKCLVSGMHIVMKCPVCVLCAHCWQAAR